MQLKNYQFNKEEILLLKGYRDNQDDARLQRRFLALLMVAEGISIPRVLSIIGISESTLERWFSNYTTRGIDSLSSFQYQPKQTYLTENEKSQLVEWVKKKHLEIEK